VIVRVDPGSAGEEPVEVRPGEHERAEERGGAPDSDRSQVLGESRHGLELATEEVEIPRERRDAADENDVPQVRPPVGGVRKDASERGDDELEVLRLQSVGVPPLHHHAPRLQTRAGDLVELPGEQVADAGHPDVRRIRNDHVVVLRAREEDVRPSAAM
jgi:hypothetical protein